MASGNITTRKITLKGAIDNLFVNTTSGNTFDMSVSLSSMVSLGGLELEVKNVGDNVLKFYPYWYVIEHTPTGVATLDTFLTLILEVPGVSPNLTKIVSATGGDAGEIYYKYVGAIHYPKKDKEGNIKDYLVHAMLKVPTSPLMTIL